MISNLKKGISRGIKEYDLGLDHGWEKEELTWKKQNNPAWQGDNVGYGALHDWIKNKLGSPLTCSNCSREGDNSRMFHWHNINGKYERNLNDWIRLCAKCHKQNHVAK